VDILKKWLYLYLSFVILYYEIYKEEQAKIIKANCALRKENL